MGTPYVGEIRIFAGNFAPLEWAFCDGRLLPISQFETLFNLIGTTYGGDGQSTFALPDLRGRVPVHMGGSYVIGLPAGTENVTINVNQMPAHQHFLLAAGAAGNSQHPSGGCLGDGSGGLTQYHAASGPATMNPRSLSMSGGNQPHDNIQPYLVLDFIISLYGIFPTPN